MRFLTRMIIWLRWPMVLLAIYPPGVIALIAFDNANQGMPLLDHDDLTEANLVFIAVVPTLLPLFLASIGFWLRQRQTKRGECKACRHPLMDAAVCPECGRAATAT